ncbi:superoxide dismutase family protein [Nocardiopsis gilva YIM 90087]|uniref:Superoxide dismutase family protein n=2 Tax=Nocardiopsis gilva TaxID=280236 RepID=A0A223S1Z4_9ACTN|nr:superoxide dismutase family protein [Nocardiopsis gilva]ASU82087.1 superoxide dismutase family protein [Nocardiopsis gilva YIM 90087]
MTRALIGSTLVSLLLAGCGAADPNDANNTPEPTTGAELSPSPENGDGEKAGASPIQVSGTWEPYSPDATAITYDDAVPEGKKVDVDVQPEGDARTRFILTVNGLEPDRDYGSHVHTKPCGKDPADSGPHYQNEADPDATPSVNPDYANPENEVWLDFTTDGDGNAESTATVDFRPRTGEANSVVIHENHTKTGPGEAGKAGDRLACVNVPM